jgi:excisionase family DNA binding protein
MILGKPVKTFIVPGIGGVTLFEAPETLTVIEDGLATEMPTDEVRRRLPSLFTIPTAPYGYPPFAVPSCVSPAPPAPECAAGGPVDPSQPAEKTSASEHRRDVGSPATDGVADTCSDPSRSLVNSSDSFAPDLPRTLGVRETAKILGCGTKTVHRLCNAGRLVFHWLGNRRRFRPENLLDFWETEQISKKEKARLRNAVDGPLRTGVHSASRVVSVHGKGGVRQSSDPKSGDSGASSVSIKEIRELCQE